MSDTVSTRSRYKDTPVFTDASQRRYYGIMEVPQEFASLTSADFTHYTVRAADVGFPDNIAVNAYGFGYEDLWWVIPLVNGMVDIESELVAGITILLPPRAAVLAFLSRVGNG